MKIEEAIERLKVEQIAVALSVSAMRQEGYNPANSSGLLEALNIAITALKEKLAAEKNEPIPIPAADVVEVVRCKDCKYRDPENHHCDHPTGCTVFFPRKDEDFCSYGERREP